MLCSLVVIYSLVAEVLLHAGLVITAYGVVRSTLSCLLLIAAQHQIMVNVTRIVVMVESTALDSTVTDTAENACTVYTHDVIMIVFIMVYVHCQLVECMFIASVPSCCPIVVEV